MQASFGWAPPGGTLGTIIAQARQRADLLSVRRRELIDAARDAAPPPPFAAALLGPTVAVIAEVKRRSPSKGAINPGLDAPTQAAAYVAGGAAAISVLTEPLHFGGSAEDLERVRQAVRVPVLRKDFHVDPVQLAEARALGASAALLIARALGPGDLERMADAGGELGLELLIEVRDEAELARALAAGPAVVGINARDLETLVIEPSVTQRLLPLVPAHLPAVAESGVRTPEDVRAVARAGADAVLVGSSISAAEDPASAVHRLTGVPRARRGR